MLDHLNQLGERHGEQLRNSTLTEWRAQMTREVRRRRRGRIYRFIHILGRCFR